VTVSAVIGLLLPVSAAPLARPAYALADWIGVEAAGFQNDLSGTAAIEGGGVPATDFDFEDTLGVEDSDTSAQGRLWFRWGKKNRLFFDYLDAQHVGEAVLSQVLSFNGTTYLAGEQVATSVQTELLQGRYRYSFVNLKPVEFGLGLGVNQAHFVTQVDGSVSGRTTFEETLPFPSLATGLVVKPLPSLHIRLEGDVLDGSVSGDSIRFLDWRAQLEWYVLHVFGFVAGYRALSLDVESEDDFGEGDIEYAGPYLALGLKF